MTAGPPLEALTRRLAETPGDFLEESTDVAAVVSDLLRDLGGELLTTRTAKPFQGAEPRRGRLLLVAAWLLHDEAFIQRRQEGGMSSAAYDFLATGLDHLVDIVEAEQFVADPDRREELARLALRALSLLPAGESAAQAADRIATLDSVERVRIMRDTRAAQERVRKIQEAMQKKAAEEAAASYGRE